MFPNESFLNFIEVRSSSEPAVLTALVPLTVELAVLATEPIADCAKPDR
jgi:hypothetical protein